MIPYGLMYWLGFAPWERRNVPELWRPLFEGPLTWSPAGRLTSVAGPGATPSTWRGRGWQVTAVEFVDKALAGLGAPGCGRRPD